MRTLAKIPLVTPLATKDEKGEYGSLNSQIISAFSKLNISLGTVIVSDIQNGISIKSETLGRTFYVKVKKDFLYLVDVDAKSNRKKSILRSANQSERNYLTLIDLKLSKAGLTGKEKRKAKIEALLVYKEVKDEVVEKVTEEAISSVLTSHLHRQLRGFSKKDLDDIIDVECRPVKSLPKPSKK